LRQLTIVPNFLFNCRQAEMYQVYTKHLTGLNLIQKENRTWFVRLLLPLFRNISLHYSDLISMIRYLLDLYKYILIDQEMSFLC
jgi:hypothetical protein